MRKTNTVIICCMTVFMAVAFGCGNSRVSTDVSTNEIPAGDLCTGDCLGIGPSELQPDALVFAAGRGGGFLLSPEQEFFVGHHGDYVLYVFGDRRVIRLDMGTIPELGYRVFRQGTVPEETFAKVLALAAEVEADDGGEYQRCPMLDGPTESLFVGLPGPSVLAFCFSSFAEPPDCGDGPEDWETPPPEALVVLFTALTPLADLPGEIVVTDRVLLGGYAADGRGVQGNCDATNAVSWPFDQFSGFPENEDYGFWTQVVEGEQAAEVRDFIRANLDSQDIYYPSACVSREGQFYRVFYDDMLPGEEEFPF